MAGHSTILRFTRLDVWRATLRRDTARGGRDEPTPGIGIRYRAGRALDLTTGAVALTLTVMTTVMTLRSARFDRNDVDTDATLTTGWGRRRART
jgi:hypothetical protein